MEQERMDEIGTQSSQLLVHEAVQGIEKSHRERQENIEIQQKQREEVEASQNTNNQIQMQDEIELDREDAVRKALVQEVIDSAIDSGNPLPSSAIKLLNNFRGTIKLIVFMVKRN